MTNFKTVILLSYLLLFLGKGYSSKDIACTFKTHTKFENFEKRLETRLHFAMREDPYLVPIERRDLSSYRKYYHLNLRYPVYAFPGKATLYIKLKSQNQSDRYLCYSHPIKDNSHLTLEQQDLFIDRIIPHLTHQIKIEAETYEGDMLKPGYYTNREFISLDPVLEIELMGKRTELLGKKQYHLSPKEKKVLKKQSTTIKEEQDYIANPKPDLKEDLSPMIKQAKKFSKLKEELSMTWSSPRRSQLYQELSLMYSDIGQHQEAYHFAKQAQAAQPNFQNKKRLDQIEGPMSDPVQRFRYKNKKRGLRLSLSAIGEYDSNVIQEAINSFFHSDKNDFVIHANLKADKKWKWDLGSWKQQSSYDLNVSTYTEHNDLDLITHRLGHDLTLAKSDGENNLYSLLGLGFNYLSRRGTSLLSGWDASSSISYYQKSIKTLWNGSLYILDKRYTDHFFEKDERTGMNYGLALSAFHTFGRKDKHQIALELSGNRDDLNDNTQSYYEQASKISWKYRPKRFISSLKTFYRFAHRSYSEAEFGRSKRTDDKITAGISLKKKFYENLSFDLAYQYTDNQSKRRVNRYRRDQVSLTYRINF